VTGLSLGDASVPDTQELVRYYTAMLRIRLVEERIAELYREQEMRCPVHLCIGQEAVAVGVCAALRGSDRVMSGHRSHGHYLAKGGDLRAMLAEFYGKVTGCCLGKGGSMHLVDQAAGFVGATPIVGSTIPIAVGVAFAAAVRGEGRVTAVFFGEGATEEGVFHESLNFAALEKLPIIFVCENNLYSVYSPLSVRQPESRDICRLAEASGARTCRGDGNDVVQVASLAGCAAEDARSGQGPVLMELATYRWREHCGPNYDNDLGYRTEAEFLLWKARCPIRRLRDVLLASGAASDAELATIAESLNAEISDAVAFAKSSPFPPADLLMQQVYA
jgi:TPP-dependent pyruvate/acetoin dehydrogenase alpha subunit